MASSHELTHTMFDAPDFPMKDYMSRDSWGQGYLSGQIGWRNADTYTEAAAPIAEDVDGALGRYREHGRIPAQREALHVQPLHWVARSPGWTSRSTVPGSAAAATGPLPGRRSEAWGTDSSSSSSPYSRSQYPVAAAVARSTRAPAAGRSASCSRTSKASLSTAAESGPSGDG